MMQFAFYGRTTSPDWRASQAWQFARGRALIEPHGGVIVVEFFDIDKSRSIPPQRRPEASRLLAALADPNRGFDAVVGGEPQRAFYGNQFGNTFPLFEHYGVPLWVPEVGGPIDPANEAHDMIMSTFGSLSKGERNRIKVRVRAAMSAQAQMEGRYLGARPPYGYMLIDVGPHPNPAKAADGKRLHALGVDPVTAAVVERIFAEFIAGAGIYAIAERLTADGIPCPSAHDRERNRHRCGLAWSKSAVRAILANPRYTGRQVWNRQRKDEVLLDVRDVALGHTTKMRWNDQDQWIYSEQIAHPPIIDDDTFAKAQQLLAAKNARKVIRRPRSTPRAYVLRGVLFCGICHRRMQGSWDNNQTYYRCTYPNEYAQANNISHPRVVYVREAEIIPELDAWLSKVLDPAHLPQTIDALAAAQEEEISPEVASLGDDIAQCDRQLAQYRAALDSGGDPAVVGRWITETQAKKLAAEARLHASTSTQAAPGRMTREQIAATVNAITDLMTALRHAAPADKAAIYAGLNLRLTYSPNHPKTVTARAEIGQTCTKGSCPRGDRPHTPTSYPSSKRRCVSTARTSIGLFPAPSSANSSSLTYACRTSNRLPLFDNGRRLAVTIEPLAIRSNALGARPCVLPEVGRQLVFVKRQPRSLPRADHDPSAACQCVPELHRAVRPDPC
jgi:site-specific DNA recombinase